MRTRTLVLVPLFAALSGCASALHGTWKSAAEPPADTKFAIKQVVFRNDSTYSASARSDDKNLFLNGKYDFNGMKLTLKSEGKPDRTYDAIVWWGKELEVRSDGQTQRLEKQ